MGFNGKYKPRKYQMNIKKYLVILLLTFLSTAMYAQSSAMLAMAQGELQKRGLTEAEVRTALMAKGIDVDSIPPDQYASYQPQVMAVIQELEASKKAAKVALEAAASEGSSAVEGPTTVSEIPVTMAPEARSEGITQVVQAQNDDKGPQEGPRAIYGHSLLTSADLEVFRTTNGAEAPDNYVLDEGDEVHISIFGASQTEIHQRIGPDGAIQPVGASRIFLKGMTLEQARTAIRNNMAAHYSFRVDQIAVTITTARTITVHIYGEVGTAGGFTLSALNTAFNAVAAAGGPTSIGTVRNIQHIRGNKTSVLDLYSFMNKVDPKANYDIRNNDIIFIPVAQKVVSVEGAVNRPMRYELVDGETLVDLIRYAGGLTPNAYSEYVRIERVENGEPRYREYNLGDVMSSKVKVSLENGDEVVIKSNNKPMENVVHVEGEVYYPGDYDLLNNTKLSVLLAKAQPTLHVKKDYLFVERTRPDETVEVITVPFPGGSNPDFELQGRDRVRVLEEAAYRDVAEIEVAGQVRRPFSRNFGLNDRMTVSQAIEYAGGLVENVSPVAYIVRMDLKNPVKREYVRVELDKDGDMNLQPGDVLHIYDNSTYTNIGQVNISGAVKRPYSNAYDPSISLHDLIVMAGGFEVGAAYDRVEVFRNNISLTESNKLEMVIVEVDENYNVKGDFQLQPYDHVVVRRTPNFTTGRTVEINGRVKYPGVYVLEDNKVTLGEIIEKAGGLLDDADPYASLFRTFNNRGNIAVNLNKARAHRYHLNYNPILMDGDVVNVNRMENIVTILAEATYMDQYAPEGQDAQKFTVVHEGNHSAEWYINRFAGGFHKNADLSSVTVTMPNGQSLGTKKVLGMNFYPVVDAGGTISLSLDAEKVVEAAEPKEKVDWNSVLAQSLTTLTSVISMIALISRL